ncbi:MAG: tetratricopeptide repeat protein [Alphaproteobacteria bacterium]|nr:tetratricopeptide repeat protein [Alphaproteobacteria bacterium]
MLAEFPQKMYNDHLKEINGIAFSAREIEVIAAILLEKPTQQIPDILPIVGEADQSAILFGCKLSEKTVFSHIDNIYEKLSSLLDEHKAELRKKTTKRDKIKYGIEQSKYYEFFKKYCVALQIEDAFLLQLEKIFRKQAAFNQGSSAKKSSLIGHCQIHYLKTDSVFNNLLYTHLARHLNDRKSKNDQKIITTILKKVTTEKPVNPDKAENPGADYTLYIIPEELRDRLNKTDDPLLTEVPSKDPSHSLFLLDHWKNKKQIPGSLKNAGYVHIDKQTPYYESVFEILKKMFPDISIEGEILEFTKARASLIPKKPPLYSNVKALVGIGLASFGILCGGWLTYAHFTGSTSAVRSDLVIPESSSFLERPKIIKRIEEKLSGGHAIRTVALVGVGGIGKTTLAHHFGRLHKASIVWEINSETHASLMNSFRDLACILSKTEDLRKESEFIQTIQQPEKREKQLLAFVRNRLRENPNWILLYDNVDNFSAIQSCFPHDPLVWGEGKVILTTRDANIKENHYLKPDNIIQVDELTDEEALTLFSTILYECEPARLSPDKKQAAIAFLKNIPSFPLDVALTGYYLKATHISYQDYLVCLKQPTPEFKALQENVLDRASDYKNTRYNIIRLSLDKFTKIHPDFTDLLFFISLIHSQDIPKALLNAFKNKGSATSFAYNLKMYSLISDGASLSFQNDGVFSMHRNTQEMVLSYLMEKLSPEEKERALKGIVECLVGRMNELMKDVSTIECENISGHALVLLGHENLLNPELRAKLMIPLGNMLKYPIGNHEKAKTILTEAADICQKNGDTKGAAKAFGYLGATYSSLKDNKAAQFFLEQSLKIDNSQDKDSQEIRAFNLAFLGTTLNRMGEHKKSLEFYRQSLEIWKNAKNNKRIAWIQVYMAMAHIKLKDFDRAIILLKDSLSVYEKGLSVMDVAWTKGHLGAAYIGLNDPEKARSVLEESLRAYQKNLGDGSTSVFWVSENLGRAYTKLGLYSQARSFIQKAVDGYSKRYGEKSLESLKAQECLNENGLAEKNYQRSPSLS